MILQAATPIPTRAQAVHILANAIDINSERLVNGEIDAETWEHESLRLLSIAAECGCIRDVLRLVAPSCGARS